jgi:hypothetical protein
LGDLANAILRIMDLIMKNLTIQSQPAVVEYLQFDDNDRRHWKIVFDHWKNLKVALREYQAREPNLPEGLSEVAFCLWSGSVRKVKCSGGRGSFDTLNLRSKRVEQVKACSVERDLTSFGPDSIWDDLYFLDFWNDGRVDGTFDVYQIPNDLIYSYPVNRFQTMRDQQQQGRRPRFSLKKLVDENQLKPKARNVQVWR